MYTKKMFKFDFIKNREPYEKIVFHTSSLSFHRQLLPCRLYHGYWHILDMSGAASGEAATSSLAFARALLFSKNTFYITTIIINLLV